jgi:PleD family two-component response regulator
MNSHVKQHQRIPEANPDRRMAETESARPPLVLIANDEEWWTRSLESFLAPAGYAILRAYNGQQALARAKEAKLDLIFLDAGLPDIPGIEVCRKLRDDPWISRTTPILITTAGRCTRERRLEALGAGAWDYLGLPLDADELLLRLESFMQAKFDADRSQQEGLTDPLTGLYNLHGLMRRARELGSDAYRNSRALACVAFAPHMAMDGEHDGEGFWGAVDHVAGVLRSVGRVSDAIGRVRQGEFVVIAPETTEDGARKLAERLSAEVEAALAAGGKATVKLLAGYDAVPDFRTAGIQPAALLAGATTALRRLQAEPGAQATLKYDGQR